ASSNPASRSTVSTGIERLDARGLAVTAEGNLLDPRLGFFQARLAVALQPVAFLVELDRPVERRLTLFERTYDLLEPGKRGLEAQLADVGRLSGGHGRLVTLTGLRIKQRDLFDRRALEGVADARDNLVVDCTPLSLRERRGGVAHVLVSLGAQLHDQGLAVAVEARVGEFGLAGSLGSLGDGGVELALRGEAERHRILGSDVRHVPVRALTDRGDGGARGSDQLADLAVADLGMVLDDPGDSIGLVLPLGNRRIAWAAGPPHLVGDAVHLQAVVGVFLPLLDLLMGQLAGTD